MHSLVCWSLLVTSGCYSQSPRIHQEVDLRQVTLPFYCPHPLFSLKLPSLAVQMYMNLFTKRVEKGKSSKGITEKGEKVKSW